MAETINAVDAWLGSLPGHVYANVRQPPISTLNLAHMIPLSAVWAGPERDEHFAAPPLLFGKTEGSTPFRFSLHVGDVGHTLIVGPTGAGKSVLLALMALQFRRYKAAQVFAFDFGGSIRAAALAMRGDWHDLGGGLTDGSETSVSLQPLARIEETAQRAWAGDWIVAILIREGVTITPEVDGKMLARLGAVVFVGVAITAAVIEFTRQPEPTELRPLARERNDTGDIRQRLRRCRDMGEAASRDPACLEIWAENRDRFLRQGARASGAPDAPTTLWPSTPTEDPIAQKTEHVVPPEPARPHVSPDDGGR